MRLTGRPGATVCHADLSGSPIDDLGPGAPIRPKVNSRGLARIDLPPLVPYELR